MKRAFPSRSRKRPADREALTILEVLVSIGLLTLGLLGVVVLIPIAAQKVRQGIALDDSTAVARAGLADFKARGGTNLQRWLRYQPGNFTAPNGGPLVNLWGVQWTNPPSPLLDPTPSAFISNNLPWSFCIDPMMYESALVQNGAGRDACFFPYQPQLPSPAPPGFPTFLEVRSGLPGPTSFGRMLRVTMNWGAIDWSTRVGANSFFPNQGVFASDPAAFPVGLAESMCRSGDELLLNAPGEEPAEGFLGMTVGAVDSPASQKDFSGADWDFPTATRIKRQFAGNTSWFATMTALPGSVADNSRYYTLSIAVVDKRDMVVDSSRATTLDTGELSAMETLNNVESERTCGVRFTGGGLGGGEIDLVSYIPPTNATQTALAIKSLSRIREGNWILVSGPESQTALDRGHIFYWYRIGSIAPEAAVNPFNSNEVIRTATLRGPDWPGVAYPLTSMAEATIVSNVINVFEQTVELRGN